MTPHNFCALSTIVNSNFYDRVWKEKWKESSFRACLHLSNLEKFLEMYGLINMPTHGIRKKSHSGLTSSFASSVNHAMPPFWQSVTFELWAEEKMTKNEWIAKKGQNCQE